MTDGSNKQAEFTCDLGEEGVSRRNLFMRLSALGIGFGTIVGLGVGKALANNNIDIVSTNPALNNILTQAKEANPTRANLQRQSYARALHPRTRRPKKP